jgi:hypothetical protein
MNDETKLPFELRVPGTWIVLAGERAEAAWDLQNVVQMLETYLSEAAIALFLYEGEKQRAATDHQSGAVKQRFLNVMQGVSDERRRIEAERGGPFARDPNTDFLATQAYARKQWAAGEIPESFRTNAQFLYLKNFVFAADSIGDLLGVLSKNPDTPTAVKAAYAKFYAAFPTLKGLRNSAHHTEDRIRRKARNRDITPELVVKPGYTSNAMSLGTLGPGDEFGMTLADGSEGTIAVTRETLSKLRDHVQAVLDGFEWTGPPGYFPRP